MYTAFDRIFGDFTAKNTVYTPYYMVLANPSFAWRDHPALAEPHSYEV
jgi:hypothetical protein